MAQNSFRKPFQDNGQKPTSRRLQDLLPGVMTHLDTLYKTQPEVVLKAWADVIGERFLPFTKAVRFEQATLHVHVKNSSLLTLLNTPAEKLRLAAELRKKVPGATINQIVFRIG